MSNGPDAANWRSHCTSIPVSILSSAPHEAADHGSGGGGAAAAGGSSPLRERDYIGLSDSNSCNSSSVIQASASSSVNAKDQLEGGASKPGAGYGVQECRDTELRLGIGPNSETSTDDAQSKGSHNANTAGNGSAGDKGIITSEQQLQQKAVLLQQQQQAQYNFMNAAGLNEKKAGDEDQQKVMMQRAMDARFPFWHAQADQAGKDMIHAGASTVSSRMMMMAAESSSRFAIPVPKVSMSMGGSSSSCNNTNPNIVAGNNIVGNNNAHHHNGSNSSSTVPAKRTFNETVQLLCDNSGSPRVMATSCSVSGCMGPPAAHHHHHHHPHHVTSSHTPPPPSWNKSEPSPSAASASPGSGWHMAYHYSPPPPHQQHTQTTFASANLHHHHPHHAEAQHLQQQRQMLLLQQQQQHHHHHHHHLTTANMLSSGFPPRPLPSPSPPAAPLTAAGPAPSCSNFPQSPSHEYKSELASAAAPTTSTNSNNKALQAADSSANNDPGSKARVVGWPPIRSFRKHTLAASNSQPSLEKLPPPAPKYGSVDPPNPPSTSAPDHDQHHQHNNYVKVKLDGIRICRKVDLRSYDSYDSFKSALQDMFQGFVHGNGDNSRLDLIHGHNFVLTYEDKDGDLMFAEDVPWETFSMATVKSLRIMQRSEATGLGVHKNVSTKVNFDVNIK